MAQMQVHPMDDFNDWLGWGSARRNREFNAIEAQNAREFAHNEALLNREWQERMSNSAYQRSVADMKKAGINPILMASSGMQGASTPSGSMAGSVSAQSQSMSGANMANIINATAGMVDVFRRMHSDNHSAKYIAQNAKMNALDAIENVAKVLGKVR